MIYQHATFEADRAIAQAVSEHVEAERRKFGHGGLVGGRRAVSEASGLASPGAYLAREWPTASAQ